MITEHRARRRGYQLPPTTRQIECLRAYVGHGTHAAAADAMGVSERTLKSHLATLRQRLNVQTTAQAVYVLWLGYRDHLLTCPYRAHHDCVPPITESAASSP